MKRLLILQTILLAILPLTSSCSYREEESVVNWKGPNDKVELVFFYKKGTNYEAKQNFENSILHKPHPEGKGYDSRDGVSGEFFVRNSGYEGYAIEFYPNATLEQRERLKKAIESSPIVYRVYENVVPNQIQDL